MSKNKNQGTRFESALVEYFTELGLEARRLAEGGLLDPGDIELEDGYGDTWVIEAKHRQSLSIHTVYQQVQEKAERAGYLLSALIWKRNPPKKDGQSRRPNSGPPLVVMDLATFGLLVTDAFPEDD